MKFIYYLTLLTLLIIGCGEKEQKTESSKVDLDSARHNIIVAINDFNAAYYKKDWEGIKKLLSPTVHIYGTDSTGMINSAADFKNHLENEWKQSDQLKLSSPNYLYIEVDKDAELANAIYQVLFVSAVKEKSKQYTLRFSNTYKKENGEWKLVHMIMQLPNGQLSQN